MYKLSEPKRYEEFLKESPVRLQAECALLRMMIELCVEEGRYSLANALLGTLAKLSAVHQQAEIKAGELLERHTAFHLMRGMTAALVAAVDRLGLPEPEREAVIDGLANDMDMVLAEIQPKQLGYERPKANDS